MGILHPLSIFPLLKSCLFLPSHQLIRAEPPTLLEIKQAPAYSVRELLDSKLWGNMLYYMVDLDGYRPEELSWIPAKDILDSSLIKGLHFSNILMILPPDSNENTATELAWLQQLPVSYSPDSFLLDWQRAPSLYFWMFKILQVLHLIFHKSINFELTS